MKASPFLVVSNKTGFSSVPASSAADLRSPVSAKNRKYVRSCLKLRLHLYMMCVFLAALLLAASRIVAIISNLLRCSEVALGATWNNMCTRNDGL